MTDSELHRCVVIHDVRVLQSQFIPDEVSIGVRKQKRMSRPKNSNRSVSLLTPML